MGDGKVKTGLDPSAEGGIENTFNIAQMDVTKCKGLQMLAKKYTHTQIHTSAYSPSAGCLDAILQHSRPIFAPPAVYAIQPISVQL